MLAGIDRPYSKYVLYVLVPRSARLTETRHPPFAEIDSNRESIVSPRSRSQEMDHHRAWQFIRRVCYGKEGCPALAGYGAVWRPLRCLIHAVVIGQWPENTHSSCTNSYTSSRQAHGPIGGLLPRLSRLPPQGQFLLTGLRLVQPTLGMNQVFEERLE